MGRRPAAATAAMVMVDAGRRGTYRRFGFWVCENGGKKDTAKMAGTNR